MIYNLTQLPCKRLFITIEQHTLIIDRSHNKNQLGMCKVTSYARSKAHISLSHEIGPHLLKPANPFECKSRVKLILNKLLHILELVLTNIILRAFIDPQDLNRQQSLISHILIHNTWFRLQVVIKMARTRCSSTKITSNVMTSLSVAWLFGLESD